MDSNVKGSGGGNFEGLEIVLRPTPTESAQWILIFQAPPPCLMVQLSEMVELEWIEIVGGWLAL